MKKNIYFLIASLVVISHILAIDKEVKGDNLSQNASTADELLNTADDIFQSRDYQAALEKYDLTYKSAREEFNRSVEVEALSQMARMNLLLNNIEKGKEYLSLAEGKASDDDPMGWSRFLGVRGRFEWKDNNLDLARKTFIDMLDYCNANALWNRSVDAAHMMAIIAETPEEQIRWGYKGIEAAESADQEKWLGPLWNNLAATYYDTKQFDSALLCYQKSREYHWRFSGETAKLYADYHIGMTYRLLGEIEKARQWLRPVLAWAERLDNHSAIGQACEDLGECEVSLGNNKEALVYLKRARDEYKIEGYDKTWQEIWDNINKRIKQLGG